MKAVDNSAVVGEEEKERWEVNECNLVQLLLLQLLPLLLLEEEKEKKAPCLETLGKQRYSAQSQPEQTASSD